MVVILNNSSFQFSKVHVEFQECWRKKKLEPLCIAIINSNEKNILFIILAMTSVSKMKNSVYNLIGLEDSYICDHYLTEFFHLSHDLGQALCTLRRCCTTTSATRASRSE